jgi:uncharacterized protein (DUF4415 family)
MVRFGWDEAKRKANIRKHGFDFVGAERVFDGYTVTVEDTRFQYDEQRFITFGILEKGESSPWPIPSAATRSASFRYGRQPRMRRRATSRRFQSGEAIDLSDIPEVSPEAFAKGLVRKGLKPIVGKAQVTLRIDADVIEWFRGRGRGYQTRINSVLKAYKEAHRGA